MRSPKNLATFYKEMTILTNITTTNYKKMRNNLSYPLKLLSAIFPQFLRFNSNIKIGIMSISISDFNSFCGSGF